MTIHTSNTLTINNLNITEWLIINQNPKTFSLITTSTSKIYYQTNVALLSEKLLDEVNCDHLPRARYMETTTLLIASTYRLKTWGSVKI